MINAFRRDIITITRPNAVTQKGAVGYIGETKADETVIASNVPADIQKQARGGAPSIKLPGDVIRETYPKIFFNLARDTVQNRDIITDQNGLRYQVTNAYWTVFQYQCECELLQT